MGIRQWFRENSDSLLGRDEKHSGSLGEYDSTSYPAELREQLQRREEVTRRLLSLDITNREARIEAIPQLRDLLAKYPHPLAYETLIHAYIDAGRFDEAKGVAFAAKQRRTECSRSEYPEIRSEVDRLSEWSPEDIEELKAKSG